MNLLVVLLAAASIAPLSGGSDPMAVKLMAECKAASGGAALDRPAAFHEQGTFVRDGATGSYDEYGDLHAMKTHSVHTFKDHTDYGGFNGDKAWRQGTDGAVRLMDDPKALAEMRSDAYGTIGGYFYPDRFPAVFHYRGRQSFDGQAYDVVEAVPENADGVNLWLDAKTHRVARLTTDAQRDAYAEIFDYRNVDGNWISFASNQVEPGHKLELRLTSYSYTAIEPALFDPPKPK